MSWKVTLGNGRVFDGLRLDGNMFITSEEVSRSDFVDGLHNVKIECSDKSEAEHSEVEPGTHERMTVEYAGRVSVKLRGFCLKDVEPVRPESVEALRADVDYLLMLSEEA